MDFKRLPAQGASACRRGNWQFCRAALVTCSVFGACLTHSRPVHAADWVIKHAGQHPNYAFELEPEIVFVFDRPLHEGPGLGVRGSISIVDVGFVSSINDSVAFTFGLDKDPVGSGETYYIPLALQWNFWLTRHWSVLGEPGVLLQFQNGTRAYPQIWGGVRFHLSDRVAFMLRVTLPHAPAFSVGLSFFF